MGIKGLPYFLQGVGEGAVVVVERGGHGGVLGALAGEDEDGFAGLVGVVVGGE
ncbi:hypothetical protein LAUMK136_05687 [Mycobacterium attenuatum]|uniref:Uncharacterized protein n=1 Tax=Mycobacterium attenuatum TaxID=2341086 RepID=A0A498QI37_9MYCO|nr:hypothetical protein LAUMK136_05687 [Mycobacterium attenuatum]